MYEFKRDADESLVRAESELRAREIKMECLKRVRNYEILNATLRSKQKWSSQQNYIVYRLPQKYLNEINNLRVQNISLLSQVFTHILRIQQLNIYSSPPCGSMTGGGAGL